MIGSVVELACQGLAECRRGVKDSGPSLSLSLRGLATDQATIFCVFFLSVSRESLRVFWTET